MEQDQLRKEIGRLKQEKGAVIFAHNYQPAEVQDIADVVGDSLELSRLAAEAEARIIVLAGVYFMAETAKILAPDKKVIIPDPQAGCPLADMASRADLIEMKNKFPGRKVVSYVNTTAGVKAETDICCTSANAVKLVNSLPDEEIIFVPDRNLASYVRLKTGKRIIAWNGYCPIHEEIRLEHLLTARASHPEAPIWAHPECRPEVLESADRVLSTGQMMKEARTTSVREVIVATETGLLHRLSRENPDKKFYPARAEAICQEMKKNSVEKVYLSLLEEKPEIEVDEETAARARAAINRMIQFV
ncbi:MAG TPA: quinolinate synthase NadA [Candidatus Saccharicenans sp.]|jgi:quinolinate synthase|nr:quinolinate synthase NadA [Candidatus Saccharicenans sp.]HRD03018.1 quinolinate synthase NadA [Candidatus Saccharicenans sp.]